jgi:hypothetical protein
MPSPNYEKNKCNWEKCTAGHFDKQDSLKNHVKKHTGEEKDIFLKFLLIDQAFFYILYIPVRILFIKMSVIS